MGKPHPMELRSRVIAFVEEGHGHREAARHFRVSPRFVNGMVILKRESGGLSPKAQGSPTEGKLAPCTVKVVALEACGRYGDGQCWTLVEAAITGAGGKSSIPQTPNFGPNVAYVWGTAINVAAVQAGDVVQYQGYAWTQTTRIDTSSPEGTSFSENSRTEGRGLPHHSALVINVISPGMVEVIEQNIPPRSGPVQSFQIALSAPATTSETTRSGSTVTVTTISHSVSGVVRCYRPVAA